jgi:hypothetical protein
MVRQRFGVEHTRAGFQYVIPGTEKPVLAPRIKYATEGSQFVIPGAEQVSAKILLNRFMEKPLRARVGQRSLAATPLFGGTRAT